MSIMRQSGHWAHSARRTHLLKWDGRVLGWTHPRILREAVYIQGQGHLCLEERNKPVCPSEASL